MIIILLLALNVFSVNGQGPIQPYKENDYSFEEIKAFVNKGNKLSFNWRKELANIINIGLANSGETIVLKETLEKTNMNWVLENSVYERKNLISFKNSKRVGDQIVFYPDANFDGMVAVFRYGKCELVIFKTRCMNLLKDVVEKNTQVTVVKTDTIYKKVVIVEQQQIQYQNQQPQQNGYGNGVKTYVVGSGAVFTPYPNYNCNSYFQPYYGNGCNNYYQHQPHYQNCGNNNGYYNNSVWIKYGAQNYPKSNPQPHHQPQPHVQTYSVNYGAVNSGHRHR